MVWRNRQKCKVKFREFSSSKRSQWQRWSGCRSFAAHVLTAHDWSHCPPSGSAARLPHHAATSFLSSPTISHRLTDSHPLPTSLPPSSTVTPVCHRLPTVSHPSPHSLTPISHFLPPVCHRLPTSRPTISYHHILSQPSPTVTNRLPVSSRVLLFHHVPSTVSHPLTLPPTVFHQSPHRV